MKYEDFKNKTIESEDIVREASAMDCINTEFVTGFLAGMRQAREIFIKLEDELSDE